MRSRIVLFVSILWLPLTASAAGEQASQKEIFLKLRRAAEAPTFEGAQVFIQQINPQTIEDPDLASLYAIAKNATEFCLEVGIPRDSAISYFEIVARLDKASIVTSLMKKGVTNAPVQAAHLVTKALRIKSQIPTYIELDRKLAERFGLAPAPSKLANTLEDLQGTYSWRAGDRTVDFDLKPDGTFTAYNKPDDAGLEDLVREGKGVWNIEKNRITIKMTHVWVGVFWKQYPVIWIDDEKIESATTKKIELESSAPLIRK